MSEALQVIFAVACASLIGSGLAFIGVDMVDGLTARRKGQISFGLILIGAGAICLALLLL